MKNIGYETFDATSTIADIEAWLALNERELDIRKLEFGDFGITFTFTRVCARVA